MTKPNPKHIRILLIDDDEDEFILVRALLSDRSYQADKGNPMVYKLDWAETYEAGLQMLDDSLYDAYLVDYRLGNHNGLEWVREALKRNCQAPIIVLTGQGNYAVDIQAMEAGATDYLVKGEVNSPLLERTIRYAIERKRAETDLRRTRDELELRVRERTLDLQQANQALVVEVGERKRAEAALQTERQRLFSLLNELPAYVYLQAPDYSVRFANCQFSQEFGEPQAKTCYEVIHQQQRPCEHCPTFTVFDTQKPVVWESAFPDGRSYQVYDYPFTDVDGSPLVLELGIDISQRKQMEMQLEQSNRDLRALSIAEHDQRTFAESLVQATIALNTSLNLEQVLDGILEQTQRVIPSRATVLLLMQGDQVTVARQRGFEPGVSMDGWIVDNQFALSTFPLLERMRQDGLPALVTNTSNDVSWGALQGLDWLRSCAAVPLKLEGQVNGFLTIFSDKPDDFNFETTGRLAAFATHAEVALQNARLYKQLEKALTQEQATRAELIQAEKFASMGRMVASVAHELNNPLQTIKNCLFLVQQDAQSDAGFQAYLNMAYTETQRLSNLVTQLRVLSRARSSMGMQSIDLVKIVEEIHLLLAQQLANQKITWQLEAGPGPYLVTGSPDQLKQVFLNLTSNAIDAMQPHGGQMTVSLIQSPLGDRKGVAIGDTGPGIPPENLPKLFEPFFTTKSHGLGLGLSICYEIIDRHGGCIEVSSPQGQGATFTVWLPANNE